METTVTKKDDMTGIVTTTPEPTTKEVNILELIRRRDSLLKALDNYLDPVWIEKMRSPIVVLVDNLTAQIKKFKDAGIQPPADIVQP